ncbi:diaminopimelate decarboxylase [Oxalobacter paraformigenes]|uniref:Diaminopimelate decarboxylase n=1 Tax=Oxalobacter paraformigenes TaxID=556268 RepID=C3X6K1_9BURK|nr:diaminopimelate decarboxylase [Oxalobacter paraformigenes]EEO28837.1 diaminopimelate decarboxylase [Oxalobacter paraformigenes]
MKTAAQHFIYQNDVLTVDGVPLDKLAAQFGTPLYVYSKTALIEHFHQYADTCKRHETDDIHSLVCYSVKSNSNLAILNILGREGAGFDIVSGGELLRVIAAGCDPRKVIFSGVGKTTEEISLALKHDILCFNVESFAELQRINRIASEMGKKARISFRVNPDVDPKTHPYISTGLKENKFGIPFEEALSCYEQASKMTHIDVTGIDCHIGSQLLDDSPLLEALDKLIGLYDQLAQRNIELQHIDIGGGIGITYDNEEPVAVPEYLSRLFRKIGEWKNANYPGKPLAIMFEPGRSISGNAGLLLTQVQYLKTNSDKHFAIVDAAMNDLMRPSLYEAWHTVLPVVKRNGSALTYDVVGPVCESGDWLARQRKLSIEADDYLAVMSAGAYGMAMASNYNTRGRAAEVLVDNGQVHLIRQRERAEELYALETIVS